MAGEITMVLHLVTIHSFTTLGAGIMAGAIITVGVGTLVGVGMQDGDGIVADAGMADGEDTTPTGQAIMTVTTSEVEETI
tara:strand:- start:1203 stop:1442 length:240 start_codon:yes stop_codon:yes gene_type:complete